MNLKTIHALAKLMETHNLSELVTPEVSLKRGMAKEAPTVQEFAASDKKKKTKEEKAKTLSELFDSDPAFERFNLGIGGS